MKLKEFSLAIFIAAGSLQAQVVGIGTKTPEGVLHMKTQTKNAQGENIQGALVLPTPDKAENVKNIQGGQPAPGSLVFDQNKQCLRYFYLTRANDPDSGQWSECSAEDKMINQQAFFGEGDFREADVKEGDLLSYKTCAKDYVYGVVKSYKTKRKWLDRNMGAHRAAQSKNDKLAIGNLYQWGRESDGHECWESETTDIRSDSDRPGHDKFVVLGDTYRWQDYNYKWQNIPNKDLWKIPNKLNNPCPPGFHVPSKKEWKAELKGFTSDDDAFNSPLRLVRWGFRHSLGKHSDWTYAYWSDDPEYVVYDGDKGEPRVQFFDGPESRSMDGMAIRCIADE